MRNLGLKAFIITLVLIIMAGIVSPHEAIAKKKKKGLSEEEMTQITTTTDSLLKKVYSASLFSPKDNESLIDLKIKLDGAMAIAPNPDFASLYYKAGYIYNKREYRDEAIECFQTILDNFSDSPYASRAMNELKKMGVKILAPGQQAGAAQ